MYGIINLFILNKKMNKYTIGKYYFKMHIFHIFEI